MEGTIYKLYNIKTNYYYYGKTTRSIQKRFISHLSYGFSNGIIRPFGKLYNYMKTTKQDDWELAEIEFCPIDKLKEREAFYVNSHIADPFCLNQNAIHLPQYIKLAPIKSPKIIEEQSSLKPQNLQEAIHKIFNNT